MMIIILKFINVFVYLKKAGGVIGRNVKIATTTTTTK